MAALAVPSSPWFLWSVLTACAAGGLKLERTAVGALKRYSEELYKSYWAADYVAFSGCFLRTAEPPSATRREIPLGPRLCDARSRLRSEPRDSSTACAPPCAALSPPRWQTTQPSTLPTSSAPRPRPPARQDATLTATQTWCVRLATPLLLLGADMRRLAGSAGRLSGAFALGAAGSTLGILVGYAAVAQPMALIGDPANGAHPPRA